MDSVLIIADIEGSTGCQCREDAKLFTPGWAKACRELSLDLAAICIELKKAGVERIRIKDFHRTGYNIFREMLPAGIELDQGYCAGPAAGIGEVTGFNLLMLVGLHAASGTSGFLPHTLTSKFAELTVNGNSICEAELFASSVASFGLAPIFFSGCPEACRQAKAVFPEMVTHAIAKPAVAPAQELRQQLAFAAVSSLRHSSRNIYAPQGPFTVVIKMRDGAQAAAKTRKRWGFSGKDEMITFDCADAKSLYWQLIRAAYLTPLTEYFIDYSLPAANALGWLALQWAEKNA
jgi:D-aminopeptidase